MFLKSGLFIQSSKNTKTFFLWSKIRCPMWHFCGLPWWERQQPNVDLMVPRGEALLESSSRMNFPVCLCNECQGWWETWLHTIRNRIFFFLRLEFTETVTIMAVNRSKHCKTHYSLTWRWSWASRSNAPVYCCLFDNIYLIKCQYFVICLFSLALGDVYPSTVQHKCCWSIYN